MEAFLKWVTDLSHWWVFLSFAVILTGLFFLFNSFQRTKKAKFQLLVLSGIDLVTLLFFLLTFNLRISKLAASSGATPRTMPRLWAFLMLVISAGSFFVIIKKGAKEDHPLSFDLCLFNPWKLLHKEKYVRCRNLF